MPNRYDVAFVPSTFLMARRISWENELAKTVSFIHLPGTIPAMGDVRPYIPLCLHLDTGVLGCKVYTDDGKQTWAIAENFVFQDTVDTTPDLG